MRILKGHLRSGGCRGRSRSGAVEKVERLPTVCKFAVVVGLRLPDGFPVVVHIFGREGRKMSWWVK